MDATHDAILRDSLTNQYNEMSKVLDDLPHLQMVYPSLTFNEHLTIHGSKRDVELHCFGGGHTSSDLFLYIPDDNIAFMGDIVTDGIHLPIFDPEAFISILAKVRQINIDTIVPGHGEIGTLSLAETLTEYLSNIIKQVKKAHDHNKTFDEFTATFSLPDQFKNWKGINGIKRNLTTVYSFYKS
ncbi:MBL fold metallo-hydrolase [Radiobacillus sp. PE A8.2]|uniref:MBL fold metallo-hydrolase n=1 Tax=Radiobacillus sp. PE A8.2 TaxID=3380349 RepID=UPI0038911652